MDVFTRYTPPVPNAKICDWSHAGATENDDEVNARAFFHTHTLCHSPLALELTVLLPVLPVAMHIVSISIVCV